MKEILLTHTRRYPLMQPQDAVKLLYQSQFGGGHMIQDEAACLEFLYREYAATPQTDHSLWEDIGNGMVRVHLSALDAHHYTPQQLGQDFIRSAASVQGSMDTFLQNSILLKKLASSGDLPFSAEALAAYLTGYAAAGYPAVSHSEVYRNAYHPAYRVVQICQLPDFLQQQV